MKAVILVAGKGRRLGNLTKSRSKALTEIGGRPILGHLVERMIGAGIHCLVPVLGHAGESVLDFLKGEFAGRVDIEPAWNHRYALTNNLSSLYAAREVLAGDSFIICNGDMVLNGGIIATVVNSEFDSAVALDDRVGIPPIDSPKTIVRDGRIYDLGRHIPLEQSGGYAIGVYKYGAALAEAFFDVVEHMPEEARDKGGFHDPLCPLFEKHAVMAVSTQGMSCMDIDEAADIEKAELLFQRILEQERG